MRVWISPSKKTPGSAVLRCKPSLASQTSRSNCRSQSAVESASVGFPVARGDCGHHRLVEYHPRKLQKERQDNYTTIHDKSAKWSKAHQNKV
jgi:hypothetical protein